MKIYYQWIKWSYSHIASENALKYINKKNIDIIWIEDFTSVWEMISKWNIWILPIENSYAWSIHENLYNFLRYDHKIIWEINLRIEHSLISKENKLSNIKEIYSHPQAISQCYDFLKKHKIKPIAFNDTASAAKMLSENNIKWAWAIASSIAWKTYKLNIVSSKIQDQKNNTTRFFIICKSNSSLKVNNKNWKITIIFETKNIPAVLYKCLWAFATNNINLTKIESLPSLKNPFSYLFWLDFEWSLKDNKIKWSLKELSFFTNSIKILWEY